MTHPGEYFLLITSDHRLWRLRHDCLDLVPEGGVVIDRFNWKKFSGVLPFWEVDVEIFDYNGRLDKTFQSLPRWAEHA